MLEDYRHRFRIRFALKAAGAAVLCTCINTVFHLENGYLAPVIAIMVITLLHGQVPVAGYLGGCVIAVAASVSVILTTLVVGAPLVFTVVMLVWLFVWMAFLPRLPLAHIVGGISIALTLFNGALGLSPPRDFYIAFLVQVFLGITGAAIFDRLIWPTPAGGPLREAVAAMLEDFACDVEDVRAARRAGGPAASPRVSELTLVAHVASLVDKDRRLSPTAASHLALRGRLIWERLQVLKQAASVQVTAEGRALLDDVLAQLACWFRQAADAVLSGRPAPAVADATAEAARMLVGQLAGRRGSAAGTVGDAVPKSTVSSLAERLVNDQVRLATAVDAMALARRGGADATKTAGAPWRAWWPTGEYWRLSAKSVLIMAILLIGVVYLDFPGSSLVAFYGVLFSLTANIGQLYMKGRTGTIGVLAGLLYGFLSVLVVTQSPHYSVLMACFALGVFVASYVATGREAWAFAGLQAALVIPYALLIFEGPVWTLADAATRAAALVVAAVVATNVHLLLWPVDPLKTMRTFVSHVLADLTGMWDDVRDRLAGPDAGAEAASPAVDAVVQTFDRMVGLLADSRYVMGSRNPAAVSHLRLLTALQNVFVDVRSLARLVALNPGGAPAELRRSLAEPLDAVDTAFEVLVASHSGPVDRAALTAAAARMEQLAQRCAGPDGWITPPPTDGADAEWVAKTVWRLGQVALSLAATLNAMAQISVPRSALPRAQRVAFRVGSPVGRVNTGS